MMFMKMFRGNYSPNLISLIVAATDFICNRFLKINPNSVSVKNFPIIEEFDLNNDYFSKKIRICYIGSISEVRGIKEIVSAMCNIDCELNLAGNYNTDTLRAEVSKIDGWQKIIEYGFVNREQTKRILQESRVGLVTLYPTINYKEALPVKMFEYMMAGIPFVASNIELWKSIAEENNCGLIADPYNPQDIADKVNALLNNPQKAKEMGENGKKAILEKYNWNIEFDFLLKAYQSLIG
jgi:glycosyltransferase involved in cell wall biosynthesis